MASTDLLGSSGSVYGGSALGNALTDLLMCNEIQPGSAPSYAICKTLVAYHPLARKMVYTPIQMAQSQRREITVPTGPQERVIEAFNAEWKRLRCDKKAAATTGTARTYGLGTIAIIVKDDDPATPLDLDTLWNKDVGFNVLDPLNTSGSNAVLTQDPNALSFQNTTAGASVSGIAYHPSRTCVLVNEEPLYIEYTGSAFGYTGRSVFQRALFPLKSFIQAMRTDDLVVRKAGVIIAKIKQTGSLVDNVMSKVTGQKRVLAKEAITDDVLSIGDEDTVESLNLMNLEGPYTLARRNIIENLASASDMPAKILNSQTFAEGFGEGTEDAKDVARYIDSVREDMTPVYDFLDTIVMRRAWSPSFYETIQSLYPEEYGGIKYEAAFASWANAFKATWPSLLIEPESERVKVDEVRFTAATSAVQVLLPKMDPKNTVGLLDWYVGCFNSQELLFPERLDLDLDELESYVEEQAEVAAELAAAGAEAAAEKEDEGPRPPGIADALGDLRGKVARLPDRSKKRG